MVKTMVRQPYAYDSDKVSEETGLKCMDDTLTVQSEAEDADLNTLVKRFHLTGEIPTLTRLPLDGDFTGTFNYQDALDRVREADELFMTLPADIRRKFDHNPDEFIHFCTDPNNKPELEKMGLLKPPEAAVTPILVKMEPQPAPEPKPEAGKTG